MVHPVEVLQVFMTCAKVVPEAFWIWTSCQSFVIVSWHTPQ